MKFEYLELRHILAMQEVLIQKYGGLHGIRDRGLLESALAQPQQSAFGEDLFPDLYSKAAAYAFYLSENQPFLDGNKRIATAAALTFLDINGYQLQATQEQLYDTIMRLANKRLTRDQLADWLRAHSKKAFARTTKKSPRAPRRKQKK